MTSFSFNRLVTLNVSQVSPLSLCARSCLRAMHHIHRPELRPWISPDKITAQQFIDRCAEDNLSETIDEANMTFAQFLKHCRVRTSKSTASSVPAHCDPVNLTCDEETVLRDGGLSSAETGDWLSDVKLESVKYLQQHPGTRAGTVDYAKLNCQEPLMESRPIASQSDCASPSAVAILPYQTLQAVIVVQVFRPTSPADVKKSTAVVDMEIEVLSCQTLLDVRLSICCASDLDKNISLPESRRSAFFFIDDTFFNDNRAGCIDYSKTIMDWAGEPGRGIGPFTAADMSCARIADLTFQLGYPYLYVHQGDCEHWIVFKDVRLLPNRQIRQTEYPKLRPVARRNQVRCDMCRTNVARWTNRENMRLAVDPGFFCDECHRSFNYDSRNEKIGSFQSQAYIDKSVLL